MRKLKRFLITLLVLALVASGTFGGAHYYQNRNAEPVFVYPFTMVGMTEFWGDTRESYGPVSTDRIQTVFLSDSQSVSEVLVEEGQTVSQGDVLMTFDTTLSQLELERKEVGIQKLNLELEDAYKRLQQISWMVPMSIPPDEPETEPDVYDNNVYIGGDYQLFFDGEHNGLSAGTAVVCWVRNTVQISNNFLVDRVGRDITAYHGIVVTEPDEDEPTKPTDPTEASVPEETADDIDSTLPDETVGEVESTVPAEETLPIDRPTDAIEEQPTEPIVEVPTEQPVEQPTESIVEVPTEQSVEQPTESIVEVSTELPTEQPTEPVVEQQTEPVVEQTTEEIVVPVPEETVPIFVPEQIPEPLPESPDVPASSTEEYTPNGSEELVTYSDFENVTRTTSRRGIVPYYAIIKVTADNSSKGKLLSWLGIHVDSKGGFSFFDATGLMDYSLPPEVEPEEQETTPSYNYMGSGYTYYEIAKMKNEQQQVIDDLERKLKMEEMELKIMKREISDGRIYAEVDGKVLTVLDEEEAKLTKQPIIKVSAGGGYYIDATVSELELDRMFAGQEVSISDWESGMTYTGVVTTIGDYPTSTDSYNGMDNPNASTYPFTVFADETANLRADSYVSVMYSAADTQSGIYLEKPYIRNEQGSSVVYVQGMDGLLERRVVKTGKSIWGSYTEILEGLSEDDLIAFPYGKTVKTGAPTREGNYNDLYGY